MIALGFPLSWKKTCLGICNTWLGFMCDLGAGIVTLSPTKLPMVLQELDKVIDNANFQQHDVHHMAGTLNWATGAYPILRPYLCHIYAWLRLAQSQQSCTRAPRRVRLLALVARYFLLTQPRTYPAFLPRTRVMGGSDASAAPPTAATHPARCWWSRTSVGWSAQPAASHLK